MPDDWKARLDALKRQLPREPVRPRRPPAEPRPAEAPPEPPHVTPAQAALDDDALFQSQMAGVSLLAGGPEVVPHGAAPARPRPSDDDVVLRDLRRLVDGDGPFRFSESEETVEAAVHDLDRSVLKKLKAGDLAVEARLDLHGLTAREARPAMDGFIEASVAARRRVVCVVTGRGLHSKEGVPVLKRAIKAWLTRSRLALHVLAFVSARPADGGVGAVYVLLRRDRAGRDRPELLRE